MYRHILLIRQTQDKKQSSTNSPIYHATWGLRGANALLALTPGGDEQKRRALALIGPVGLGGDLLLRRAPFLDVAYHEPGSDQHIHIAAQGPVSLDDAFGQPIRRPRALLQIAVH